MSLLAAAQSTDLRWHHLPPLWVVVLLIVPGVFLAVRFIYRREAGRVGRRPRMVMGVLRALAVLLVLGALFGPYAETIQGEYFKRHVIVAVDTSRSMGFRDGYPEEARAESVREAAGLAPDADPADYTRLDLAKRVLGGDAEFLAQLADRFRLHVYTFDDGLAGLAEPRPDETPADAAARIAGDLGALQPGGAVTRIGAAIRDLVRAFDAKNEPVAGVFLFTDGRHTGGAPNPVEEARRAAEGTRDGIPVYPVAIGDPGAAINVGVSGVDAPEVVLAGDEVSFRVSVHARGYAGRLASLEAIVQSPDGSDGEALMIDAEPFELPPDGETRDAVFRYRFDEPGTYDLKVGVPPLPGEAVDGDNHLRHVLRVVKLKMRVLLVTGKPNYTYRFLKETLLRATDTIEAQILLLSAEPEWPQEASAGLAPLRTFPQEKSELAPFDVIILMDVDVNHPRITPAGEADRERVLGNLEDWVAAGGGLVLQAGRDGYIPGRYAGTPLMSLLPVVPGDAARVTDLDLQRPKRFRLTPEGRDHPIMGVLRDPARTSDFWDTDDYATSFLWYAPVERAKSGATVLAERREEEGFSYKSADAPPHPMIAVQKYGAGTVLWIATDELWRMRRGVENLYFWRFWSGAVRHLATYRLLGGNKRIKIFLDRSDGRYHVGDPIVVEGKFLDEDFEPVAPVEGDAETQTRTLRLRAPDGEERDVVLQAVPEDPPRGIYRAKLVAGPPGTYRLYAPPAGDEERAERTFVVEETTIETRDPLMDWNTLTSIAHASGGEVLTPAEFRGILRDERIASHGIMRTGDRKTTELWDRNWVLFALVGLLAAEWILRRRNLLL